MTIGEAARRSGVSAKMIRYYESIGLGPRPSRSDSNYRHYDGNDVDTLRFIGRAREFGLPIGRIRTLVGLWQDEERASRDVKEVALAHVADLRRQAARLSAMADALATLADRCSGDGRPQCPILDGLENKGQGRRP